MEKVRDFTFLGSKITADGDCSLEIRRCLLLGRKAMTNLVSILKTDITIWTKVHLVWELDHKEGWTLKNWCFWTVVLEKTLESPLDCKEIQPVHPKGNQSWIFTGRSDAETEAPIRWPSDGKNRLIEKYLNAGEDWRQKEKRMIKDEMVGWHHRFNGHEFEQAPGVGDGQGSLVCCHSWGRRVGHDWVTELILWPQV